MSGWIIVVVAGVLACAYYGVHQLRLAQVSRFGFYRPAGLVTAVSLSLLFLTLPVYEVSWVRLLRIGLAAVALSAQLWRGLQEVQLMQAQPAAWQQWKARQSAIPWLDRLLLYRGN